LGLTFRRLHNPVSWRNCPSCKVSLVDDEVSNQIKQFCEPGAFYSKLLGGRNLETNEIEYWKCPECKTLFPSQNKPIIHSMSNAYLK
jgi:rubredoxin